ncbi:hypothetical protein W5M_06852 [Corynebacterium diphtheriae bv. intermedius str. NCTC 5011]|nr:hypothetical protein W5M_06852 [Corynebacterium diphtheriae bv. intermedius str. NCTC 5011]
MSTSHTPKPGPRPGAVPGPRPGAHAARKVVAPNVSAMNQARAFGRVDDDGTVYLIRGGETKRLVHGRLALLKKDFNTTFIDSKILLPKLRS